MDFDGPYMWGFGWFGPLLMNVLCGILAIFTMLVVIGLIFLLVRFLLVGTKAAQLYLAKNAPPAATPATTATTPATAPAKPRTPKTPPAS